MPGPLRGAELTARETWDEFWKLVMGTSPVGEVLRAVIFYLVVLVGAYFVGLVNATAGAILTLVLVLVSVGDLLKTSEESFWNLSKRLPSTLAITALAYALGQSLDYAFGIVYILFLVVAGFEHFFPDSPTAKRRRKRKKR